MKVLYSEFLTTLWKEKQLVIVFEGLSCYIYVKRSWSWARLKTNIATVGSFYNQTGHRISEKVILFPPFFCFVCFPAALCSDNLPRCPTFLIAGSFNHSTRKWISEMWWRLMAPLIACLTSHVLPKCVNLCPPPPWKPSTFINALWRGLNLCENILFKQTGAVCAVSVGGWVAH